MLRDWCMRAHAGLSVKSGASAKNGSSNMMNKIDRCNDINISSAHNDVHGHMQTDLERVWKQWQSSNVSLCNGMASPFTQTRLS